MSNPETHWKASTYPEPLIVAPRTGKHIQSFIVLHGRGSNATYFGPVLLQTQIPGVGFLQDAYPNAKFIFPTASKRRAKLFNRTPINQWFDNWSPPTTTEHQEIQFDGLRESSTYIHSLLHAEIAAVGPENVVLWGLSQGAATSLISLLLWEGPKFAAAIGMCGWLPLRKHMEDAIRLQHET